MDKPSVEYIAEIAWHSENGVLFFETDKNNNVVTFLDRSLQLKTDVKHSVWATNVFDVDAKLNIANALA